MIRRRPPAATFAQDDSGRLQVVSAQIGNRARKEARPAGSTGGNSPPRSRLWDLQIQSPDEYGQFVQPQISSSENKPQRKNSFRPTR